MIDGIEHMGCAATPDGNHRCPDLAAERPAIGQGDKTGPVEAFNSGVIPAK